MQVQGDIPRKVAEVFVAFAGLYQSRNVNGIGKCLFFQQVLAVIFELTVVELHRVYIVGNGRFRHNVVWRSGNECNVEVRIVFVCQGALNDTVAAGEHYVVFGTVLFRGNFYVGGAFQQTDVEVTCGGDRDIQAVTLDCGVVEGQPESVRGGGIREYLYGFWGDRIINAVQNGYGVIGVVTVYTLHVQGAAFDFVFAHVNVVGIGAFQYAAQPVRTQQTFFARTGFGIVVIVSFVGYDLFGIAVYGRSGYRHYGNGSGRDRVIVGRAEHEIVVGEFVVCQRAVGDNIAAGIHLFAESVGSSVPGKRGVLNGVAVNHARQAVFDDGILRRAVFVSISAGHGDGQSLWRYRDVLIGQQFDVVAAALMPDVRNIHNIFVADGGIVDIVRDS